MPRRSGSAGALGGYPPSDPAPLPTCGQWQSTPRPLVCLLVVPQPECLSDSDFPEFAQTVRYGVPELSSRSSSNVS